MPKTEVAYAGHDLESMDLAVNYHAWIYDLFAPFLGTRIVEVGAGSGAFSKLLLRRDPERLWLVEPSQMYGRLRGEIGEQSEDRVSFHNTIFESVIPTLSGDAAPDTIVYINVLEHIDDDERELRLMHNALADGGNICIFVPAVPMLLSDFDKQIGHFRRYSRKELIGKCERAGFEVVLARGFDLPGVVPWLVKYRLMRSLTIGSGAVKLYDRLLVPLIRPVEQLLKPPIGKNLLLVARKLG
jgi:SAM-dependent methyltransferase